MAPNRNIRWPHTALLAGSTSGPERRYRWPPQAQILTKAFAPVKGHLTSISPVKCVMWNFCWGRKSRANLRLGRGVSQVIPPKVGNPQ
jgi:hypothetical protein